MRQPIASRLAGAGLALAVAACTSVRPVEPAKLSSKQLPSVVSVTYPDQTVIVLMDPELSADTLKGLRWGTQDSVVIPLASVQTVEAKVPDRTKTLLLGGAGLLAATGVYLIVSSAGKSSTVGPSCGVDADGKPYMSC